MERPRCGWCGSDPLYIAYHDHEWGVPLHDERRLFEMLLLEGAQAGLAWITVLRKRENYRRAFEGFDPQRIAAWSDADVERLMNDPGIIRNRRKIEAAIRNARGTLEIIERHGSLGDWLWRYVDHEPVQNAWRHLSDIPASTPTSNAMSRDLRRLGFNFVGPTICYAFMQATGMVNDHLVDCYRHDELKG
jgi:DNA-3-methyladenine glycosylase I